MLVIQLMNVQNEDEVCRLFPYTFEGKTSIWHFNLPQKSINNWGDFEDIFLKKFGEDKTLATLVLELSKIKIHPKEKIKDFNQIFLTLMNKIPNDSIPIASVLIEFYITALPSSIVIFVKRASKITLNQIFGETLDVEKEMMSIARKATIEDKRST